MMNQGIQSICVLGGTGFVGRHLVPALAQRGFRVRVLTRHRERHRDLLVLPRVSLIQTNVHSDAELRAELQQCNAVINLVGMRAAQRESDEDFQAIHVELPRHVAEVCRTQSIPRLLHLSALNASAQAPSRYLRSKGEGEHALRSAAGQGSAPAVTILRPAPIFGPEDELFNRFARWLARIPLALPLAFPQAKLAPVWVNDVVQALLKSLEDQSTFGNAYDLCGPSTYRLIELVRYTAQVTGRRRYILPLNDSLSKFQARVLQKLPGQSFTWDGYRHLQVPGTCRENGLQALAIKPSSIEAVVPRYLGVWGGNHLFNSLRCTAGRD